MSARLLLRHFIPLQQRLLQGRTCSPISVTHVVDAMACPAAKSAVVIPAVRKGLCNQRVRMVQDILLAHLFGAAAGIKSATLPRTLRQACWLHTHLDVGCGTI